MSISNTLNSFANWHGDFAEKMCYEAGRAVFGSLSCYKELKLTIKLHVFTGHTVQGLLIQMQNISLQSSGTCRKQNFEFGGLKVTQQS